MIDKFAWSYFLFNIYISDLEIDLIWSASKFTDDKSGRIFKVDILGGHEWITKEFNKDEKTRPAVEFNIGK